MKYVGKEKATSMRHKFPRKNMGIIKQQQYSLR